MPIGRHLLAAFLPTSIIAMVVPGPDMLFILGCGMRGGPRAGLLATAGVAAAPPRLRQRPGDQSPESKNGHLHHRLPPQFINPEMGAVWLQFTLLGAILIALEFLVDGTVGVLADRIGEWLRNRRTARRRMDVATGSLFIGLGLRLAAKP